MPLFRYPSKTAITLISIASLSLGVVGCTNNNNTSTNTSNAAGQVSGVLTNQKSSVAHVVRTRYNTHTQSVTVYVHQNQTGATQKVNDSSLGDLAGGREDVLNTSIDDAVVNYATSRYASKHIRRVTVVDLNESGKHSLSRTVTVPNSLISPGTIKGSHTTPTGTTVVQGNTQQRNLTPRKLASSTSTTAATNFPASGTLGASATTALARSSVVSSVPIPPPGVRLDKKITPLAPTTASYQTKFQAVMSVATSKLGTPYIWGHNEDRGQYGFDCSNFTEYVYHHALGYLFTTASRGQNLYVGVSVPIPQMRPGDLMVFDNGGHVGIYAGNGQAIQEGGGLAKVGYLNVANGSYWSKHLTAVKRMF